MLARLLRVTRIVRETLPRLSNLGLGSAQGYSVMATATDYLPVAIGNYLRLPRDWADTRPIAQGKSSVMLLVDQLDLLGQLGALQPSTIVLPDARTGSERAGAPAH